MIATTVNRNLQKLAQKFISKINYIDIDYRGYLGKDSNGEDISPTIQLGDVITNNLKLWLTSSKGDYYRRIDTGGFFDDIQKYSLIEDADSLRGNLLEAINGNFSEIEVISLEVIPDIINKTWTIKLAAKDKATGLIALLNSLVDTTV